MIVKLLAPSYITLTRLYNQHYKFLFFEDFVIKKEYRSVGIGSKLFEETIKICKEYNLNGMIWQVLDWNSPAIDFYNKYDAEISSDWLNGKLTKKQIEKINELL